MQFKNLCKFNYFAPLVLTSAFLFFYFRPKFLQHEYLKTDSIIHELSSCFMLFVWDIVVYKFLVLRINAFNKKEQVKVDQLKIVYTNLIQTGKVDLESEAYLKFMQEVKALLPIKTNNFKLTLSKYIHYCLLVNFIVFVLQFWLLVFFYTSFRLVFVTLKKIILLYALANSITIIKLHFNYPTIKQRKDIMVNIGIVLIAILMLQINQNSASFEEFDYFYVMVVLSTFSVFVLEKLNQHKMTYDIKKKIFMIFKQLKQIL